MLSEKTTAAVQYVEGNRGGVRFEFGGLNRQQQAPHQHAYDPRGRKHRPRRGYR